MLFLQSQSNPTNMPKICRNSIKLLVLVMPKLCQIAEIAEMPKLFRHFSIVSAILAILEFRHFGNFGINKGVLTFGTG